MKNQNVKKYEIKKKVIHYAQPRARSPIAK